MEFVFGLILNPARWSCSIGAGNAAFCFGAARAHPPDASNVIDVWIPGLVQAAGGYVEKWVQGFVASRGV